MPNSKFSHYFLSYDRMEFQRETSYFQHYKEKFVDSFERALMGDFEVILFTSVLGFLWTMFALDFYLNFRQRLLLKKTIIPPQEILTMMGRDNYDRSRLYSIDKNTFNMVNSWYSMLEMSVILLTDLLPWLWRISARSTIPWTKDRLEVPIEEDLSEEHELRASLVFLMYVTIFSFVDGLPWKLYNNFVLEEKHGFNKQSSTFFILDQLKSLVISLSLILPISYCLLYIIKWGGPNFYLHAWGFAFLVMVFLMFIYPEFIAPLFDRYVPLPEGSLKRSIEDLADVLEFPLTKVFVVQGSKRSSHSNAYFYGFWKNKRIVLFDTLLSEFKFPQSNDENLTGDQTQTIKKRGLSEPEILAILSHELGHWKLNHVTQNLIIGQINLFLMFYAFGNLFNFGTLFKTFGFKEVGTPNLIKLVLIFQFLFSPYNALLEFMMTLFSRQNEFQADNFVVKMGRGDKLSDGLIKLQNDNLTFPIYDEWYSLFNHSHPPLLERLNGIKQDMHTKKG